MDTYNDEDGNEAGNDDSYAGSNDGPQRDGNGTSTRTSTTSDGFAYVFSQGAHTNGCCCTSFAERLTCRMYTAKTLSKRGVLYAYALLYPLLPLC